MKFHKEKINSIKGQAIYSITFINDNNYKITFYTYGGYIHHVIIPYKNNPNTENILLIYSKLSYIFSCK